MTEPIRRVPDVASGVERAAAIARLARVGRRTPEEEERDAERRRRRREAQADAAGRPKGRRPPPDDGLPHVDVSA